VCWWLYIRLVNLLYKNLANWQIRKHGWVLFAVSLQGLDEITSKPSRVKHRRIMVPSHMDSYQISDLLNPPRGIRFWNSHFQPASFINCLLATNGSYVEIQYQCWWICT
jgi:hypothetical protein